MTAISIIVAIVTCNVAYGYIDPGAGSLLLQLIFGAVATALGTIRIWRARLKAKKKGASQQDNPKAKRTA